MERKRKWDEPPPPPPPSSNSQSITNGNDSNKTNSDSTLSAVQAAAKRLNSIAPPIPSNKSDGCEKEFDINDLKIGTRSYLLKGPTQLTITQQTGALIRVKGSYIPNPSEGEKGLRLLISSAKESEVDAAISKVRDIIENESKKNPFDIPQFGNYVIQTVPVNLNPIPGFNIIGKLLGPSGSFVKHIQQNSNTKVQLRGKGSRYDEPGSKDSEEPLSFLITASNQSQVDQGIKLIEDLLATVRTEYNQFAQRNPPRPPNTQSSPPPPPPQLFPAPQQLQHQQYPVYAGYAYPTPEQLSYPYPQIPVNQYNQYNQYGYYSYPGTVYPSPEPSVEYHAYSYNKQQMQKTPVETQSNQQIPLPPPTQQKSSEKKTVVEQESDSIPPPPPPLES